MLLPANHYPQFTDCTTVEGLLLQLAREILEVSKLSGSSSSNTDIIDISGSEKTETTSISTNGWMGNIDDGVIVVYNPFTSHVFTAGIGVYPFNQNDLVNAFFHVALYLQKQELSVSLNVASKQCIVVEVGTVNTIGDSQQLDVTVTITDFPLQINNSSSVTTSLAKPYIL